LTIWDLPRENRGGVLKKTAKRSKKAITNKALAIWAEVTICLKVLVSVSFKGTPQKVRKQ